MLIDRFLKWVPADLSPSPVILDVGSCDGAQACEFASVYSQARIFAFEVRPKSVETVRRAVSGWPNITVIGAAVHEFDGETTLYSVDRGNAGASSLFVGSGVQEIHPIEQTPVTVPALRLDSWASFEGIKAFDLVWMDLQGAELLALRGMGDLLYTVRALQLEITYRELYAGQALWQDVRPYLESHGLVLADEWVDVCGWFGDAIFVRA